MEVTKSVTSVFPRFFYFRVISKLSVLLQIWNISSRRHYKTFVGGEFEIST